MRDIDTQRYTLHFEGCIPHLSRVAFRPSWFIVGGEKRENSWCVSPSRFTPTRISLKRVGVERQGKTVRVHRAHDREYTQANEMRVEFLFLRHGIRSRSAIH